MVTLFHSELNLTSISFRIHVSRKRFEPTLLKTITDDDLEWIQIECGAVHTVGLTKEGEVFAWGGNYSCQVGVTKIHGDKLDERVVPTKVESLDGLFITKISSRGYHTAALTEKGEILTWYVRS